jgi:hypothetical protein
MIVYTRGCTLFKPNNVNHGVLVDWLILFFFILLLCDSNHQFYSSLTVLSTRHSKLKVDHNVLISNLSRRLCRKRSRNKTYVTNTKFHTYSKLAAMLYTKSRLLFSCKRQNEKNVGYGILLLHLVYDRYTPQTSQTSTISKPY